MFKPISETFSLFFVGSFRLFFYPLETCPATTIQPSKLLV